uniref:Cysteine-rich venom protein n=1 Tax=Strigamia maritima TaxID=126957 RepID=T1INS9_STRMM
MNKYTVTTILQLLCIFANIFLPLVRSKSAECKLYEKFGKDHTMCKYEGKAWSNELETIAQRWADQCKFDHDTNRQPLNFSSAGQNAFMSSAVSLDVDPDVKLTVTRWYDERKLGFHDKDRAAYVFNPNTGHFTQVIWGSTKAIGCGFTVYKAGKIFEQLVVCNYGPAGNMLGDEVYKTGDPCNNHEAAIPPKKQKLKCVLKKSYTVAEKTKMLKMHNQFRQLTADGKDIDLPPASNMMELAWDNELEMIAQRWADQCIYDHDTNRTPLRYPSAGQNTFISVSKSLEKSSEVELAVKSWYNEREFGFHVKNRQSYVFNHKTGHFSQILFGNYARQEVYKKGEPC